ncbi:MAG: ATP synthase subunit I [Clostridia bacterium]|nr:ATP synthase subunit I [Clostridia bacterium]
MIKIKNKIDKVVLQETAYIAVWTLILSAVMQAVFLVIGKWDYTVILGNLLGAAANLLNFFLMALTVQKALEKEEKEAKQAMKLSHSMRMLMLFVMALLGILLPCFNTIATVIPFFFTRIAIMFRQFFKSKNR